MSAQPIWMVRAGRGGDCVDDFMESNVVAVGWNDAGEISGNTDKSQIESQLKACDSKESRGTIASGAAQLKRYYSEVKVGDLVTTYDPAQRIYFLGEILSDVQWRDHILGRARRVKWTRKVPRDSLAASTRNTLGAISTLFLVKDEAADDMLRHAISVQAEVVNPIIEKTDDDDVDDDRVLIEEVVSRAEQFIEDRIAKLDWDQMQELVAEILRAMGYRARTSAKGPDRGVDVFASPDGLGLQEPRIFVEVKHRTGTQMGSSEIRAFLGGRQSGDRCLYVSTGGFSKDARYEAERSAIPITLITLPELRKLVIEYYESFGPAGTALIPLERLYWPA